MVLGEVRIARAEASPDGGFYLVGSDFNDGDGEDVRIWKVSDSGDLLWTARWGNSLGWDDRGLDVLPLDDIVVVAGVAGQYQAQEFWHDGHSFARAYSHGGVVQWTWEDTAGPTPSASGDRPEILTQSATGFIHASRVRSDEGQGFDGLQVVSFDLDGAVVDSWTDPTFGSVVAVRTDAAGDLWVALGSYDPWLGHWSSEGTHLESLGAEIAGFGPSYGSFGVSGELAVAGEPSSGPDRLLVVRADHDLQNVRKSSFDAGGREFWDFGLDVAVDCAGVAWVTSRVDDNTYPLGGFDEGAAQLWTVDGLETIAVSDHGVAVTAGYEPSSDTTKIRWLRPAS